MVVFGCESKCQLCLGRVRLLGVEMVVGYIMRGSGDGGLPSLGRWGSGSGNLRHGRTRGFTDASSHYSFR